MSEIPDDQNAINIDGNKLDNNIDQIEVNIQASLLVQPPISFDSVLKKCGDLGRFHLFHYFFINLIAMGAGIVGFYYVFAAADPNHRCRLSPTVWPHDDQYYPINRTHEIFLNVYIPKTKDGKKWDSCSMYLTGNPNDSLVSCPYGWVYDRSVFGYTFTEEANLVCQHQSKKSWLATCFQLGGLCLLFLGSFADRYGRRTMTIIVMIFVLGSSAIIQALMQFLSLSVDAKFYLLIINQFASGLTASAFSLSFLLLLELTSSAHTSFAGNTSLVSFTVGEAIITGFAYYAQDWNLLKWLNLAFLVLVIPYLYFIPESPLYIYSKRKYDHLEKFLEKMAKINRRNENDWRPDYRELVRNQSVIASHENKKSFLEQLGQIIRVGALRLKVFVSALIGFTTLMLYIKISYGLTSMDISPYWGFLIGSAVEAIGYVSGSLLINTRLARKGSFITMMIFTTICVTLIPILSTRSPKASVFVAQFGKFTISGAIAVTWIFVPELFSTSIRSSVNGLFIASSRTGAIVAPIITTLVPEEYSSYTFYTYSVLSIIIIGLSLLLPETKNLAMGDIKD